jgi:hypothetical protein
MSELTTTMRANRNLHWRLLAGASAAVLAINLDAPADASSDSDRPTVWIELGGQLERVDGGQERFLPSFASQFENAGFASPISIQKSPRYAVGGDIKASFAPSGSDWIFSAALRYGRSNSKRSLHQEDTAFETAQAIQSAPLLGVHETLTVTAYAKRYSDTRFESRETQAVVDFQAGKDVGLGLFGSDERSVLNVGVRFAQFQSQSSVSIGGDPDFAFSYKYATNIFGIPGNFKIPLQHWHLYSSTAEVTRSFHGIGPSAAWDTSTPLLGAGDRGQLVFDFGINGAVLFGRQKVDAQHQTTGRYRSKSADGGRGAEPIITTQPDPHRTMRSRSVVIPNVGGFAGLSFKFPNAKISMGYRADIFFGAIDGGIDTRKTYDRAFYGPFANFSIGL